MRKHGVITLTARDLERARRELAASLARPDSPARTSLLAHLAAIDIELTGEPDSSPSFKPAKWDDEKDE